MIVPTFNGGLPSAAFANPFPIMSITFAGDDWDAAQIYRHFALHWGGWTGQRMSNRSDVPQWMYNNHLWFNTGWQELDIFNETQGDPAVVVDRMTRLAKVLQVPTMALHWYVWDEIRAFDADYPDYLPAKPGFAEAVEALHELKVRVVPYINGRLWDVATASWKADNAQAFAAKSAKPVSGNPGQALYVEQYGSGASLAVMCPATPQWQSLIEGVVAQVAALGTDGVYVDQVSAAYPVPCYDPTHGHTVGGGNWWSGGYNKMIAAARDGVPRNDFLVISEANAETYMGTLGGYLSLTAFGDPSPAAYSPAFPAIYGGFYNALGAIFFVTDFDRPAAPVFRKLGLQLVLGAQLGWFSLGGTEHEPQSGVFDLFVDPANADVVAYLRDLVAVRAAVVSHLVDGRLMRPVRGLDLGSEKLAAVWWREGSQEHAEGFVAVVVNAQAEGALEAGVDMQRYWNDLGNAGRAPGFEVSELVNGAWQPVGFREDRVEISLRKPRSVTAFLIVPSK